MTIEDFNQKLYLISSGTLDPVTKFAMRAELEEAYLNLYDDSTPRKGRGEKICSSRGKNEG